MSIISRLFFGLLLASSLLFLMPGGQAHASEPRVVSVQPAVRDGKLQIDADVEFELNQQLRDAAQRGVPLLHRRPHRHPRSLVVVQQIPG